MKKRPRPMRYIPRDVVERIAHIMGSDSACAQALREANDYGGPVEFYNTGSAIIVKKAPKESSC